jgi:uncharacterized protein YqeY
VSATVPPGTADRLRLTIARERPGLSFSVVANPEFLREGHAVRDTLEPDRIVVGSDDEPGFAAMRRLYGPLVERGIPLLETDVRTAELSKLASNAFLATKISFANALARVAELTDADLLSLLQKQIKQRQEAAELYDKGGRPELAARERAEIDVIAGFLPQQMNDLEMREAVAAAIGEAGATSPKDMGKVMALLKQSYSGRMDFSKASGLVKAMLTG